MEMPSLLALPTKRRLSREPRGASVAPRLKPLPRWGHTSLQWLRRSGEVRQRDLAELTLHEETTLTRNLRPLVDAGWVAVRTGEDRREKWFKITAGGVAKLKEARPAWSGAVRVQALLPEEAWQRVLAILPEIAKLTAGA